MPFVRCRFYTESGDPVRGGCHRKGAGCAFVHPGEPNWGNAPPPSFKARDKSGDFGGFKPRGEQSKRAAALSPWDTGRNASGGTTDTGSGWDTGGGWDTGAFASVPNQAPESTQSKNLFTTKSKPWAHQTDSVHTQSGTTKKSGDDGWGANTNQTGGWGTTANDGWQGSSWGNVKDVDNGAWGSTGNNEWGTSGWGDNKNADWSAVSAQNDVWGGGWGNNSSSATDFWSVSDPTAVNDPAGKGIERGKGKSKTVLPPPRIRIPDKRNLKITGTNNEPLGLNKRAEPRSSNLASTPTPVTVSTPVVVSTPTESTRVKRKRDAAFDDNGKLEVFKEYVKTWERAVRARFMLAEAEAKRARWFHTQKSSCYGRIGEAGRKRLDGQRTECDKDVDSQRDKLSNAITSLVDFHDTISSNLDLGQHYNVGEETKKFISESKAFVDETRALLVSRVLKEKDDMQSDDIRKCLSETERTDLTSVDSLQIQVRDLEERFEQAQTELTLRHQRDIHSEIDELLTAKILALRVARQHEIDLVGSQAQLEIDIPPSALKNMEGIAQRVSEMESKVPSTVEDIRVLLFRVDAMTKRVSELEQEVSMNKETYRQIQDMAAERQETERRMDKQLKNIREQFEQLVAFQPPVPAAQAAKSPIACDLQNQMMESLRPVFEAVLDKFYVQEVRPTVESLQHIVIEASERHQEEAIKVLWGKIQPAMNMVAGVSRWLDSQELGLTAPVEVEDGMSVGSTQHLA